MNAVLWTLALGFGAAGVVSELLTDPSNLTVGLVLVAAGAAILALVVEGPTEQGRRRW